MSHSPNTNEWNITETKVQLISHDIAVLHHRIFPCIISAIFFSIFRQSNEDLTNFHKIVIYPISTVMN